MQPDFDKGNGLVPVIVQDYKSKDVLMLAYMNKEAWEATLRTEKAHYYSRSRKKLWQKGEESGNIQQVKEIRIDCDRDTILLLVEQIVN
jgi:phosphoribosyl-AMP cyclohydrolase